jgi:hypothetical protein
MVSAGTLFNRQVLLLTDGMQMRVGIKKGARVTAHGGQEKAFIFVDCKLSGGKYTSVFSVKRTAFFSTEKLSDQYRRMVRPNDRNAEANFNRFFNGVRMVVTYDPSRTFIFKCLTPRPINDSAYMVNGKTVPQYMQAAKNITLRDLNFPGCHPDQPKGETVVYPLEVRNYC